MNMPTGLDSACRRIMMTSFENVKTLTNDTQYKGRLFGNQYVLSIPTSYLPCPPHAPQQKKKTGRTAKSWPRAPPLPALCPWTSQVSGFSPANWASKLTLQRLMRRLDEITVGCSIDVSPTLLRTKRGWIGNTNFKRPPFILCIIYRDFTIFKSGHHYSSGWIQVCRCI